jgi:hypothetical protein
MNKQLHPVEVLLVAAVLVGWSVLTIARLLLVPLVALVLTRPTPAAAPAPAPVAPWVPPTLPPLEALPVATLRRLARAEGLPACLGRSGRRGDLLAALSMAY